jgi:hypothetical protein
MRFPVTIGMLPDDALDSLAPMARAVYREDYFTDRGPR